LTYDACHSPGTASERLRRYVQTHYQWTRDTMLDQEKVHEMVVVAIERDWHVIEKHIDRIRGLVAEVISEGIATGEFADQDPEVASRCFAAAIITLCHPQMVAQCLAKKNRAMPDELIEFAGGVRRASTIHLQFGSTASAFVQIHHEQAAGYWTGSGRRRGAWARRLLARKSGSQGHRPAGQGGRDRQVERYP
jgi:hypothetical protein